MNWMQYHSRSEQYASQADVARVERDFDRARQAYRLAAEQEELALAQLDPHKPRTLGIIAVSAAALWYKAGEYEHAQRLASQWLASPLLPEFAAEQLQHMQTEIAKIESFAA